MRAINAAIFLTSAFTAATNNVAPVKLIVDTDLGSDVSNLISICNVNAMIDQGEVELLAVMTSTGLPTAIGAVSVVNHYYGHDVPLGAYKGTLARDLQGPYVADLVSNFSSPVKTSAQVPEAFELYRKTLAEQMDGTVTIAAHGFLVNLHQLLISSPDKYSPLNGTELVAQKVKLIAIMGGMYPSSTPMGHEWNFGGGCSRSPCSQSSESTAYVVKHLPGSVPVAFSGFELGERVHTGTRLLSGRDCPSSLPANPCRQAFADYAASIKQQWRQSWDSVTSLYAVRGAEGFYTLRHGHNVVNSTDGSDVWNSDSTGFRQAYLVLNETVGVAPIQRMIDDLMCQHRRTNATLPQIAV